MQALKLASTEGLSWAAEATIGANIQSAAALACQISTANGVQVRFDFNGIEVVTSPFSHVDKVVEDYFAEGERRAEAWRNSPEGRQAEQERRTRRAEAQRKVNTLLEVLRIYIKGEETLMAWIGGFAVYADSPVSPTTSKPLQRSL